MKAHAQKQKRPQQQASSKTSSARPSAADRAVHPIIHLQRTIGNQAVQRLLQANTDGREVASDTTATNGFGHDFTEISVHSKTPVNLQAKLTVSAPGDIHEQEADSVAQQVTSMPEPQLHRTCACSGGCPGCRNEQTANVHLQTNAIQAKDSGKIAAPAIVNEVLQSPGQPLELSTRAFMEPRLGHDFSQVRVHTDEQASASAEAVNALAYTVGRDVVFGARQYQPETITGKRLLAHELTHSIQQSNGFQTKSVINQPMDQYRQGADRRAVAVTRGVLSPSYVQTRGGVMRQLMKQSKDGKQGGALKEVGDIVGKTFNYKSISSDLDELKNLNISGSPLSATSDVQTLSNAIRTLRSVIKRMNRLSISQRGAQNVDSKISALNNLLSPAVTTQLGVGKQQSLLGSVSAASLTGVEPIGGLVVLEIIGEIIAAIAAILEAPVVIIIAVIVLVIWLIYEIIKALIEEADRTLCILLYGRCIPPSPCRDCLGMCIENEGQWPFDKCRIPK